ncbi:uncharacterized protein LOC120272624 [Dioscorea cayenensis subsp. rotundata]|uniref:Uncharacterized protein LOC120272624 n=1 Tax=Dioscorea cayennensis subsp. rotundata TaxID=55577 RepID=A0AB40C6M4_DIOCR|nr:uncharacterized protein LOC120272624 [Dioscorea cayenensis subsp. rotundata]
MGENDGSTKSSSRGPSVGLPYPLNPNDRVHLTPIMYLYDALCVSVFVEKGVATTVTCIIKKHFKGLWPIWRKVPSDVKELMWKTFQEYCKWNLEHNCKIKNVFDKTGKTRLRDMLVDERMKAMKEVGATNIKECKRMEREWITKDVWDALIDNECGTDAWQSKSGKAKANCLTEKEGSITKHTGGSRPFAVHGIKLEKYNASLIDKYGDDISSHPSFDAQSWYDAIGGLKATRTSVYGFGSRIDSRQLFSGASTCPSTSDSACGPSTYQPFATNESMLQTLATCGES